MDTDQTEDSQHVSTNQTASNLKTRGQTSHVTHILKASSVYEQHPPPPSLHLKQDMSRHLGGDLNRGHAGSESPTKSITNSDYRSNFRCLYPHSNKQPYKLCNPTIQEQTVSKTHEASHSQGAKTMILYYDRSWRCPTAYFSCRSQRLWFLTSPY